MFTRGFQFFMYDKTKTGIYINAPETEYIYYENNELDDASKCYTKWDVIDNIWVNIKP